jgi:hypothetical protein
MSILLVTSYMYPTQGEVKDSGGQVNHRSDLDEVLGMSTVSMDFDVSSVEGETHLQAYMQVQMVTQSHRPSDVTRWKQYQYLRVSRLHQNG